MAALSIAVWALATIGPPIAFLALLPRTERRHGKLTVVAATMLFGAVLFAPAAFVERSLETWAAGSAQAQSLLFMMLVVAPLEQGLEVAAIGPVWRSRHFHAAFDGVLYAGAAAMGFVAAKVGFVLWGRGLTFVLLRAVLLIPAHVFFASAWGWALGRDPRKRLGSRGFNLAWIAATALCGAYDTIVLHHGPAALLAAIPMLAGMGGASYLAWRDLRGRTAASPARFQSRQFAVVPPSLGAMREALLKTERPVMLTWIAFGALVTTGVITASVTAAVAVGRTVGIDFSAVDRAGDASIGAMPPLVLVGGSVLLAFPIAGFLIARASSTKTVLEPALSAGLAIAAVLVLLGLAAPVAVVFALVFAPFAFGLSCLGAWLGLDR